MSEISTRIREAAFNEASVLSNIISESFRDVAQRFNLTPGNCPKHPSNCKEEWVQHDMKRGVTYYLLEYSGTLIGCVAMEKASPEQVLS